MITDKIYGTRENRLWLKERDIRFSGKPLGRPPKEALSKYQKRKQRKEQGIRNQVEGKFGQGKNAYDLNCVRTRTARTSESWIACIMFVMNLIKFSQVFLFLLVSLIRNFTNGCQEWLGKFISCHIKNKNVILIPIKF